MTLIGKYPEDLILKDQEKPMLILVAISRDDPVFNFDYEKQQIFHCDVKDYTF